MASESRHTDGGPKRAAKKRGAGPADPWEAFAYFVSKCCEGFGAELLAEGKTDTQARNAIIGCLLDFAADAACRAARREGREPDPTKWRKATKDAFTRAVKRTAPKPDAARLSKQEAA